MRTAERGDRERAAFALATAYATSSSTPARAATSSGGWGTCRRPASARSTASNRNVSTGGRASSARSRRGWVGEIDEQLGLGLDFRRRRAALMRRPRGPACETRGGAVNDLEALEDENQRLKVALSRLVEENKRYRVNKARLEGELLRADAKVETLLSELEQAPGKRDQRLLNAARLEVEKCSVVRSLAKQKEHLQKMLARQERELDAMKRTKEWSAIVEMTAATEEYFLEIRRLQRQLAQQQQGTSASSPVVGVGDRGSEVPHQHDRTQRRSSGVDDTVWVHRPETCDVSLSVPSPADGVHDNQRMLDAEAAFASSGGDVYIVGNRPSSAPALQARERHVARQKDDGVLLNEWEVPAFRRRPASPKRRTSPPSRARMATRAGRDTFGDGTHKKVSEAHVARQTTQVARGALGRRRRGGSQSQAWIPAAEARISVRGADARRSTAGVWSRPRSAPRTKREMKMITTGDARRADSLSPGDQGRRQAPSSDRGAAAGIGGIGGGRGAVGVRQKTSPRPSSSSRAPADHRIPTVPVPTEPRTWQTGEKLRPKARSRSASPRPSSSRSRVGADDACRAQGEAKARTASTFASKHQTIGGRENNDGGNSDCDGGSDAGLPEVTAAPRSSQTTGDEIEPPPVCDDDGTSDNMYYDDAERRLSSSEASRESLAAAAPAEHSSATLAGTTATTQGNEGHNEQTTDGTALDPTGSGDAGNASKDDERSIADGDELARHLAGSSPSSWGSLEAVDEPPKNEAKEGNAEEESPRQVSSPISIDDDARENPNADDVTWENSATSTSNAQGEDGREQQDTTAEKTDGSGSNDGPNDGDNNGSSRLPEVGDDNTTTRSVSSRAKAEEDHPGEAEVDAELETDKLLFDIEGDDDSVGADPLIAESEAPPSEYGDDFDDFEDEED